MYWLPRLQANLAIARLRFGIPADLATLQAAQQYAQEHNEAWLALRCMEALAESALAVGDAQGCLVHADQLMALAKGDKASAHRASAEGLAARIADSLRGSGLASN